MDNRSSKNSKAPINQINEGSYIDKLLIKKLAFSEENIILFITIMIFGIMSMVYPRFRSATNLIGIIRQASIIGIVAMGQAIVLISGGFDLSVGYIASICGVTAGYLMVSLNLPVIVSIIGSIIVGLIIGALNGVIIAKIKINPMITTLATGWIIYGLVLGLTRGYAFTGLPESFLDIGAGYFLGIPKLIIVMIILGIIFSIFMSLSFWGRYIYAIGGNERGSLISGINVVIIKFSCYCISGVTAAIGGILLTSRIASAHPDNGITWGLPSIAAAVIGGVAIGGGKGKIYGVIIGSVLFSLINNVLVLVRVSPYWQSMATGFILIFAVMFDRLRRREE